MNICDFEIKCSKKNRMNKKNDEREKNQNDIVKNSCAKDSKKEKKSFVHLFLRLIYLNCWKRESISICSSFKST